MPVYVLPLDGEIFAPFSEGELVKNTTLNEWRTHNGIDIRAEKGAAVMAVSGGLVTEVKSDPLWGFVVEIAHPDGNTSIYSGLSNDIRVSKGETVSARTVIGVVDALPIEMALPVHLHLEIKRDGRYVDPLVAMDKK